jgi:hypothetical protein
LCPFHFRGRGTRPPGTRHIDSRQGTYASLAYANGIWLECRVDTFLSREHRAGTEIEAETAADTWIDRDASSGGCTRAAAARRAPAPTAALGLPSLGSHASPTRSRGPSRPRWTRPGSQRPWAQCRPPTARSRRRRRLRRSCRRGRRPGSPRGPCSPARWVRFVTTIRNCGTCRARKTGSRKRDFQKGHKVTDSYGVRDAACPLSTGRKEMLTLARISR